MSVLASLSDGETLMIGGKEVEVMGIISAEDFAIAFKMHKQAMQMYFQSVEFKKHVSDFSPCVCDNGASGVCGTAGKVKH